MKDLYLYINHHIHPASLLVTVAFDLLWSVFESGLTTSVLGIIALPFLIGSIFVVCFGAVTLTQRFSFHDDWPAALSKGLALGVVAAVPFSVISVIGVSGWGLMRLTYGVEKDDVLLGKLTRSWRDIEVTLRKLTPLDFQHRSLEEVINYLYSKRYLSRVLKDRLHELRRQRNITTHKISIKKLAMLVDEVQAMENTLRARFLNLI